MDLTIVILGKTGVGKSATGNTILGRPAFKSELSTEPVTTKICEARGQVFEKQIRVIDTPGLLNSEDNEKKVKTLCENLVNSSTPCLFLVVIRVGRFTEEDLRAVTWARKILGPKGRKKSYLLFTCGDTLRNQTLDDFIFPKGKDKNKGKLPDVVMKFGGKYHVFNNEDEDQEQVRELLLKSGHIIGDVPVFQARLMKRRIILLGRPGEGKSSSGNTILGSERFTSGCDFNSVSAECVSESAEVEGRQVTVVDTPGLTDEVLTPEQLYEQIMRSIVEASPGPHAFVIVVRLGRVSKADIKLFEILPKLFGSADTSKYAMVLFTHGDGVRGRSMDQLIQSNRHVSDLVSMCGGRYCLFDNNQRGNRQQVRRFLGKVDQMVLVNGGEHFTSDLFRMVETFIREERSLAAQSDETPEIGTPAQSGGGNEPDPDNTIKTRVLKRLCSILLEGAGAVKGAVAGGLGGAVTGAVKGAVGGGLGGAVTSAVTGAVIGAVVGGWEGGVEGASVGACAMKGGWEGVAKGGLESGEKGGVRGGLEGAVRGGLESAAMGAVIGGVKGAAMDGVKGAVIGGVKGAAMDGMKGVVIGGVKAAMLGGVKGAAMDGVKDAAMYGVKGASMDGVKGAVIGGVKGAGMDGVKGAAMDGVKGAAMDGVKGAAMDGVKRAAIGGVKGAGMDGVKRAAIGGVLDAEIVKMMEGVLGLSCLLYMVKAMSSKSPFTK